MSIALLGAGGLGRPTLAPFFSDNLAGGQLNSVPGGFDWHELSGGSISSDYAINGGTHSIKMTYSASAVGTYAGGPTLRCRFGREVFDLWVEYWIRLPDNYVHRNNYNPGPPVTGINDNNKFWMVWAYPPGTPFEGYSTGAWQASSQIVSESTSGEGVSDVWGAGTVTGRSLTQAYAHRTTVGGAIPDLFSPSSTRPIVFGAGAPGPIGQWNRVRFHVKRCSAWDVADGKWEMWVNDVLIASFTAPIGPNADHPEWFPYGLSRGYFLGSASSGFTEATTCYLADFKFYDGDPGWAA